MKDTNSITLFNHKAVYCSDDLFINVFSSYNSIRLRKFEYRRICSWLKITTELRMYKTKKSTNLEKFSFWIFLQRCFRYFVWMVYLYEKSWPKIFVLVEIYAENLRYYNELEFILFSIKPFILGRITFIIQITRFFFGLQCPVKKNWRRFSPYKGLEKSK